MAINQAASISDECRPGTSLGAATGPEEVVSVQQVGKVPCALVVMDERREGQTAEVVVVFGSPGKADAFARRHGLGDWVVAPVRLASTLDAIRQDRLAQERIRPRTPRQE